MRKSWCALPRSMRRRGANLKTSSIGSDATPRRTTSPRRSPISTPCRIRQSRSPQHSPKKPRRARRRSLPLDKLPPTRSRRSPNHPTDDPRHPLFHPGWRDRLWRRLSRRPPGRCRRHLARLAHRNFAVGARRRRDRGHDRPCFDLQPYSLDYTLADGAGDVTAAQRFTAEVQRLAPGEPLALLLTAQAAQLAGDREAAGRAFQAMAARPETKALGLHGLFIEARRRNDVVSARAYAEEAARVAPSLGWAGTAVLEARCRDGDWAGALSLLEQQGRMLDKATYRRQRAVLLTARARALEDSDRDAAKEFALEANKLAPDLVPAAALAGRLLAEGGQLRKASRVIDAAWRANPHPELAQAYAELRSGESARDRLKRIEAGAKRVPGHIEGALAVARTAIDALEFAKARSELAPYLDRPTRRVCVLMARL